MNWLLFLLLVGISSFVVVIQGDRDGRRDRGDSCRGIHEDCREISEEMEVHFESISNSTVFPILSETALDRVCQIYSEEDTCYDRLYHKDECFLYLWINFDQTGYKAYNDSYNFLCYQAREEYLTHKSCLARPDLMAAEQRCSAVYKSNMDHLEEELRDPFFIREALCLYIDDYLDCIENVTAGLCDSDAALWLRVIYTKNLESTYGLIGCALDTSGYLHFQGNPTTPDFHMSSTTTDRGSQGEYGAQGSGRSQSRLSTGIVVGCVIALNLLVCGVVIMIFLKYKYNKKKQHEARLLRHQPSYFVNTASVTVQQQTIGGGDAGAIGGEGFPYIAKFDEPLPEKKGIPPPDYSTQAVSAPPLDQRSSMMSPPPPYSPPAAAEDQGQLGYSGHGWQPPAGPLGGRDQGYFNPLYQTASDDGPPVA